MKYVFLVLSLVTTAPAIANIIKDDSSKYQRLAFNIPMRDGIKLYTIIFAPKIKSGELPFLFARTPYGIDNYKSPDKNIQVSDMAKDGYFFVYQDLRGKNKSEGEFEMQRFTRNKKDPKAIDESTDAYDTIEWLLKNIPGNNGKVGMFGVSYGGWTTIIAALDPHPALKAASEQATPADMWMGDDFHHNGAFRLSYGFEYSYMVENAKDITPFDFDEYDAYSWFMKLGPLSNVNKKYFNNRMPTWNNFVKHPDYDDFWKKQALASRLDSPRVPIQHVAGWWDQEDFYGPLKAYELLEKNDRHNKNFFVAGPWDHGGWARRDGDALGNIQFGDSTGITFRKQIQAKWFAYYLKGQGDGQFAEAITFQTGSNRWMTYHSWPPKEARQQNMYFHQKGKLSFDTPQNTDTAAFSEFVSDPACPVPYRSRPIEQTYGPDSRWYTWQLEDQRFVDGRPDVLSWQTDTLTSDLTVTGALLAKIFASTTGSDADWVVKLIDVYPGRYLTAPKMGGYQLMIANDVLRGRYRHDFSSPQPIPAGDIEPYTVNLHEVNHVFKKGHRIMVQIQSTWFPMIDVNPQTYVPNIFEALSTDYKKQTHRIFQSAGYPSHIALPVITEK